MAGSTAESSEPTRRRKGPLANADRKGKTYPLNATILLDTHRQIEEIIDSPDSKVHNKYDVIERAVAAYYKSGKWRS